jgi:hypothetical protein
MGMIFDNVTGRDPGWIPWDDSVEQWWHQISGSYAKNLVGEVKAEVRLSIPWQFYKGKEAEASKVATRARRGEIEALFKIPDNVFTTTELDQIHELLGRNRVTLSVNLTVDVGGGQSENRPVSVADASKHPRTVIDEAIAEICATKQAADLIINMAGKP